MPEQGGTPGRAAQLGDPFGRRLVPDTLIAFLNADEDRAVPVRSPLVLPPPSTRLDALGPGLMDATRRAFLRHVKLRQWNLREDSHKRRSSAAYGARAFLLWSRSIRQPRTPIQVHPGPR